MTKYLKRGNSSLEGLLIAVVLGFIIIAFIIPGRSPNSLVGPSGSSNNNYNSSNEYYYESNLVTDSSYSRVISLGTGNAPYAYQTYEEYITIDNRGRAPINITGWPLSNAKDERVYELGVRLQRFPADTVRIPGAVQFISPLGVSPSSNVVLAEGERAIITTGKMGQQTPYAISSFKENICNGYLDASNEYTFTPPLARNCPRPNTEPGVRNLEPSCRQFIDRVQSCRTPEFNTKDRYGESCNNCVDRVQLSSSCVAFLKSHYNYAGCIAYHAGDENFSGKTWRVFLGQGWQMWADDHDVIKLYDNLGKLVDYKAY